MHFSQTHPRFNGKSHKLENSEEEINAKLNMRRLCIKESLREIERERDFERERKRQIDRQREREEREREREREKERA